MTQYNKRKSWELYSQYYTKPEDITEGEVEVQKETKKEGDDNANIKAFRREFLIEKNYCINKSIYETQILPLLKETNLTKYKDIYLLESEAIIITYIYKYMNTHKEKNYEILKPLFEYIYMISEYFERKLHLPKISVNTEKKNLKRSSYKFCNFKDECVYNYKSDCKGCYGHHYVHNMVTADIKAVLVLISRKKYNNSEIMKFCNTLSYVIKHMYDELYNVIYYSSNKIDSNVFHKNNYNLKKRN